MAARRGSSSTSRSPCEEVEPPEAPYRTRTIAGGAVIMLTPAFGLRLDAARDDRAELGRSVRLGLGAIVTF